jgi:hypothetical protein
MSELFMVALLTVDTALLGLPVLLICTPPRRLSFLHTALAVAHVTLD